MKKYNIAVVGATGNVGRSFFNSLDERKFPVNKIHAVASSESIGKQVSFGDDVLSVESLEHFSFRDNEIDFVFGATNSYIAKQYVERASEEGSIVIDNSSAYRMDADIPLIVPEVNGDQIEGSIISNPNCCVIPLVVALKPLDEIAGIKRIVISTYQSTSGAGKSAMDELYGNTKNKFAYKENEAKNFPKDIAFNVIPKIGEFDDNLYTEEENKIIEETKKILGEHISVTATSVRMPVFVGHALSVNIEFHDSISAASATEILEQRSEIQVISQDSEMSFATPIEIVGEDEVYISRIRDDESRANSLNMWITSDNLRKGAALNAIQIAEKITS